MGIKLGDVNFDWDPASLIRPATFGKQVSLTFKSRAISNSVIKVPVTVKDFNNLAAMQFTLNYNNNAFRLLGIENNSLNLEYSTDPSAKGKIAFLWNDASHTSTSLLDSTVLMELVFTKLTEATNPAVSITSDIAPVEAYDANMKPVAIGLNKQEVMAPNGSESWEVTPNPSDGLIRATLTLNQTKQIQFELIGTEGKVLFQQTINASSGKNKFTLNLHQNTRIQTGIYYLKAKGVDGGEVKKLMIR